MSLRQTLFLYLITLIVFFAIDMLWLGLVAKEFYRRYLGFLLSPKVNWASALLFYLLFVVGLLVFAVRPALLGGSPLQALGLGGLLGLICYATYDLTNLATIRDWPVIVTVIDLVWGTVLGGVVSFLSAVIGSALVK